MLRPACEREIGITNVVEDDRVIGLCIIRCAQKFSQRLLVFSFLK
jgi:hypothetical protein